MLRNRPATLRGVIRGSLLNEVLSLNAQEYSQYGFLVGRLDTSSMKS